MMPTILRLGDTQTRSEEAIELVVKTSKCTALARPKEKIKFVEDMTEAEAARQEGATPADIRRMVGLDPSLAP